MIEGVDKSRQRKLIGAVLLVCFLDSGLILAEVLVGVKINCVLGGGIIGRKVKINLVLYLSKKAVSEA